MANPTTKQKLFTEVFAPKNMTQMILPQRIKSIFPDEMINGHYLFYAGPGVGKSRLAEILCQKHPYMYINASVNGRIDALRDDIYDFCMQAQMTHHDVNTPKVVWIDEIDGVSQSFFDGLRGFMDTFQEGGSVFFVATCNYLNKVPAPIQSRFDCINFGFESSEEEKMMFDAYVARMSFILNGLKIKYDTETVNMLCSNNFPDYRGVLQTLQRIRRAKHEVLTKELVLSESYEFVDLYKLIIDNPTGDPYEIHKILMGDYATKATDVLASLDLPFIKWMYLNRVASCSIIPELTATVAKYINMLPNMTDPSLAMKACVFDLMAIATKKK